MKSYELAYLISQNLSEEETASFQEKIKNFIIEEQGILGGQDITKKKLGNSQGLAYLISLNFNFDPEKLVALEKKLKTENQIINYMILFRKPRTAVEVSRRIRHIAPITEEPAKISEKPKKVEIKEIEKKLEEILGE